jgi:hypothetical protein
MSDNTLSRPALAGERSVFLLTVEDVGLVDSLHNCLKVRPVSLSES